MYYLYYYQLFNVLLKFSPKNLINLGKYIEKKKRERGGKKGYISLVPSTVNKKRGGSRFQLSFFFHCHGNSDKLLKIYHLALAL